MAAPASDTVSAPPVARLSFPQMCAYLGVTERHGRYLVQQRRIRYRKIGHYLRFDVADLDGFLDASVVEPVDR